LLEIIPVFGKATPNPTPGPGVATAGAFGHVFGKVGSNLVLILEFAEGTDVNDRGTVDILPPMSKPGLFDIFASEEDVLMREA
jgi:hypothetical protein